MGEYSSPELDYLRDCTWVFTEKIDGMNIRVMAAVTTWGRGLEFQDRRGKGEIPNTLYTKLENIFTPENMCAEFGDTDVCLYGEGYGAKIQKGGGDYLATQGFILFDVKIGDWWLKREDVERIAESFGIPAVPIITMGTLSFGVKVVTNGIVSEIAERPRMAEGLVASPKTPLLKRNGERVICKIKTRDFYESTS